MQCLICYSPLTYKKTYGVTGFTPTYIGWSCSDSCGCTTLYGFKEITAYSIYRSKYSLNATSYLSNKTELYDPPTRKISEYPIFISIDLELNLESQFESIVDRIKRFSIVA